MNCGDLLAGATADHGGYQRRRLEVGERLVDLLREFQRGRRVVAQRLTGDAVELAAVCVEGRGADRREHQRGRLDGGCLAIEPVVDDVAGPQEPAHGGDPVEHRRRVDGRVGGLGELVGSAGEELLAEFGGPCERRQHSHRLGDVVEDLRRFAVPIVRLVVGHRRIMTRCRPFVSTHLAGRPATAP